MMTIQLKKFGSTLVSRPSGKEAWLAFQPMLSQIKRNEEIIVNFDDVIVLTPSWADEFLTPLKNHFGKQVYLHNIDNPSVKATLSILNQQHDLNKSSTS
ncbi:STAS-like domain-containing protein [Patescibacteria group bacterium]|nr:STAS-like domain-containing protein [Patescibacteria group bacterium]MBU1885533.1 STAS-like domain-containing protein [Patescibacteria group bacterium]